MTQFVPRNARDGNSFVCRTEDDVEVESVRVGEGVGVDGAGVCVVEGAAETEFGEEAAVDEVGTRAAGFELEGTEFENVGVEGLFDEFGFPGGERHVRRR